MFSNVNAIFVGKDRSRVFRDYLVDRNFFFVFESESMTKADGHAFFKKVQELRKKKSVFDNLNDFEIWLNEAVMTQNIPAHFSLAAGILHRDILYIKTVGDGEIHMRRKKDFVRLIHGDKSASGYAQLGDMLVFTTATFRALIENEEKLIDTLDKDKPVDIVPKLEEHFDNKEDGGAVGMFVQLIEAELEEEEDLPMGFAAKDALEDVEDGVVGEPFKKEDYGDQIKQSPHYHTHAVQSTEVIDDAPERPYAQARAQRNEPRMDRAELEEDYQEDIDDSVPVKPERAKAGFSMPPFITALTGRFSGIQLKGNPSKMITLAVVVVLFGIIVWSVVLGAQRRQAAQEKQQIAAAEQIIDEKTSQAVELAFLDMDRALALINESKQEVTSLRENLNEDKYADALSRMEEKVSTAENAIVQKEEKEPEEFYDLALENEDAKGDMFFLEENKMAILDKANDTVYNFDLEKKSLEKSSNKVVGDATMVGMDRGTIFVFVPNKGLYKFIDDEKTEVAIKTDKDWGKITDFDFYGGNVYMVDSGKSDVYKYAVTESGFADKASYFIGTAPSLDGAHSVEIDSSIYVGTTDGAQKYTRGEADDFDTTFPNSDVTITRIYTDENTEKVYAWDKSHATMYVLDKNGSYEQQIKASILAKATDFVVYNNEILLLSGSKIYKLADSGSASKDEE